MRFPQAPPQSQQQLWFFACMAIVLAGTVVVKKGLLPLPRGPHVPCNEAVRWLCVRSGNSAMSCRHAPRLKPVCHPQRRAPRVIRHWGVPLSYDITPPLRDRGHYFATLRDGVTPRRMTRIYRV